MGVIAYRLVLCLDGEQHEPWYSMVTSMPRSVISIRGSNRQPHDPRVCDALDENPEHTMTGSGIMTKTKIVGEQLHPVVVTTRSLITAMDYSEEDHRIVQYEKETTWSATSSSIFRSKSLGDRWHSPRGSVARRYDRSLND